MDLSQVKFSPEGLVPVVVQDAKTGEVLTLAYANRGSPGRDPKDQAEHLL